MARRTRVLSRDDILKVDDLPRERVPVPEWGGEVFVRGMNGADKDAWDNFVVELAKAPGKADIRAFLASLTICDEEGDALFTAEDIAALSKKSAAALDRVFDVATRLSPLGAQARERAEKNSGAGRAGSSHTDSPSNSATPTSTGS